MPLVSVLYQEHQLTSSLQDLVPNQSNIRFFSKTEQSTCFSHNSVNLTRNRAWLTPLENTFIGVKYHRRNRFQIRHPSGSNSGIKLLPEHFIPDEQSNRTANLKHLVRLAHKESERELYTKLKPGMSSFQRHQRHMISTSEDRVIAKILPLVRIIREQFSRLASFSRKIHLLNQTSIFSNEIFHTYNTSYKHPIQAIRPLKIGLEMAEQSRGKMVKFGPCSLREFSSSFLQQIHNLNTNLIS